MGASSSTPRNVTMEVDQVTGVVKVSESVARRLIGRPEENTNDSSQNSVEGIQPMDALHKEELAHAHLQYQARMDNLEKQNEELFKKAATEFEKTVIEVENKFVKPATSPICNELQRQVIKCYSDNPRYTLHCADVVKAFKQCVQKRRQDVLERRTSG